MAADLQSLQRGHRPAGQPGKLIALAHVWACQEEPPSVDDQLREMARYGASEQDIDAVRQQFLDQLEELWEGAQYRDGAWRSAAGQLLAIEPLPENRLAYAVFRACDSQWEMPGGFGGRYAVAWSEVEAAMRLIGVPRERRPETFMRVRVLVEHARAKLIERQPKPKG